MRTPRHSPKGSDASLAAGSTLSSQFIVTRPVRADVNKNGKMDLGPGKGTFYQLIKNQLNQGE